MPSRSAALLPYTFQRVRCSLHPPFQKRPPRASFRMLGLSIFCNINWKMMQSAFMSNNPDIHLGFSPLVSRNDQGCQFLCLPLCAAISQVRNEPHYKSSTHIEQVEKSCFLFHDFLEMDGHMPASSDACLANIDLQFMSSKPLLKSQSKGRVKMVFWPCMPALAALSVLSTLKGQTAHFQLAVLGSHSRGTKHSRMDKS